MATAIATAFGAPLSASKGITIQYSISINGRFRAPYGIPDLLDPESFALVFKNTDRGRNTILTFPIQGGNGKPSCWLQPKGCPLSIVRAMLDEGDYIVSSWPRRSTAFPLNSAILPTETSSEPTAKPGHNRDRRWIMDSAYPKSHNPDEFRPGAVIRISHVHMNQRSVGVSDSSNHPHQPCNQIVR